MIQKRPPTSNVWVSTDGDTAAGDGKRDVHHGEDEDTSSASGNPSETNSTGRLRLRR